MFVTKDDVWGIRKTLKKIYFSNIPKTNGYSFSNEMDDEICFDIFYNQFVPNTFRETRGTVVRHLQQIKDILLKDYKKEWVWLRRPTRQNPKDLSCVKFTSGILNEVKKDIKNKNGENLPTYIEIEEIKNKWQKDINYKKENGFSNPIKEEYIQLRVIKGGEQK